MSITVANNGSFDALRCATKSTMPPSYLKVCSVGSAPRSSRNTISRLLLRKAISRNRSTSVGARIGRDPAAVVDHAAPAVGEQRDVDARRVARERLVDGVVDDLIDEVMQTRRTGRTDVHAGALAHRLKTLQNGDVLGAVRHA